VWDCDTELDGLKPYEAPEGESQQIEAQEGESEQIEAPEGEEGEKDESPGSKMTC